jgi:predicted DNA-binding protein
MNDKPMIRYNLYIPPEMKERIENLARSKHTTSAELIRRLINMGLMVMEDGNAELLIREDGEERRIMFW